MENSTTPASGRSGEDYQLSFTEYVISPSHISQSEFAMEYFGIDKRVLVVTAELPLGREFWIFSPQKSLRPAASSKPKYVPPACVYNQVASLRVDGHVGAQEHPAFSTRPFSYEISSNGIKTRGSLTRARTSFLLLPLPPGIASSTPRTSLLAYRAKQV